MSDGFDICRPLCCALSGALPPGDGALHETGLGQVLCEELGLRLERACSSSRRRRNRLA
jgi:hypothetical protein